MTECRKPVDPSDDAAAPDGLRPIVWSTAFEMGDARIDAEHREFVGIVNRLSAAVEAREPDRVAEICKVLVEHSANHFRHEEEVMAEHSYGGLEGHRRDHERLLADICEQTERLCRPTASWQEHVEAAANIKDALLGHLFRVDVHYKTHLQEAGGRLRR